MASFWKSNPRHWCEYCRCWTADNKPSIQFHELGQRHMEAVRLRLKASREKTARDNAEQREQDDMMAQINRDALAAMNADVAADPSLAAMDSGFNRAWTNKRTVQAKSAVTAADMLEMASRRTTVRSVPGARDGSAIDQPVPPPGPPPGPPPAPAASPWTEQKSPAGHVYYYNSVTMESRWTNPDTPTAAATATSTDGNGVTEADTTDDSAEVWAEVSTDDGKTYYLNAKTGETTWTKPEPKPAAAAAAETDNADAQEQKEEKEKEGNGDEEKEKEKKATEGGASANDAAAAETADPDGALVGDSDWAYTAEEAAENDKAAKKPNAEITPEATEETGVGKDRSVPAHLVAKAAAKAPAFKVKRPTQEGVVGGWSIVIKSNEQDLQKIDVDAAAAADDADVEADVPSSGVDENGDAIKSAQRTKTKASLTTIDNSGVQFTAKAMPALKRRGLEGDTPVMLKKKKRKGNQNFKRREKQF